VVDRFYGAALPGETFSLNLAFSAMPYSKTLIPQACETLLSPTVLATVISDEGGSPIQQLGFTMSYFGTATTRFSMSANGFGQLHTASAGSVNTSSFNEAINGTVASGGLVAPYWDDLRDQVSPATRAAFALVGTAPNRHLVMEWKDYVHFLSSGPANTLTFQIKLFETSNVIEFHYCALGANMTGNEATIGLRALTGTLSEQHSLNTPGAVSTTNALRFTP
jgi:hypothetical protein